MTSLSANHDLDQQLMTPQGKGRIYSALKCAAASGDKMDSRRPEVQQHPYQERVSLAYQGIFVL
jgi:hypothetical protein